MALWAVAARRTVSIQTKRPADRRTDRDLGVSILAIFFGAIALGIVQTERCPLGGQVVREVAFETVGAVALEKKVFARGYFGRVVDVTTSGSFGT